MEQRLAELELKYLEQQELLQQLSNVIYEQQQQLGTLETELRLLARKLEGEPGMVDAARNEPPPHY